MAAHNWIDLSQDADTGIETLRAHFEGHAYDPHGHDSYLTGAASRQRCGTPEPGGVSFPGVFPGIASMPRHLGAIGRRIEPCFHVASCNHTLQPMYGAVAVECDLVERNCLTVPMPTYVSTKPS